MLDYPPPPRTMRPHFAVDWREVVGQAHLSPEEAKKALHRATYSLKELKAGCGLDINDDIRDWCPSMAEFCSALIVTIAAEFFVVYYVLYGRLGADDSFDYAVMTMVFISISALVSALGRALAAPPPLSFFRWRKLIGTATLVMGAALFVIALGLLSRTRADIITGGFFQSMIEGYYAMISQVEILLSGAVNALCFGLLMYEFRIFLWSEYWGYRDVKSAYDEAKQAYEHAKKAELG